MRVQRARRRSGHGVLLAVLGMTLVAVGAMTAAAPAHAEGRLLRVQTNPNQLHFTGLQPGDRVEFIATVDPLGDDPITVTAHVEAAPGQQLFSEQDGHSTLDVATCPKARLNPQAEPARVICPDTSDSVLAPTVLQTGRPIDVQLPDVAPHEPLSLRIGLTITDQQSAWSRRAHGTAEFRLTAIQVPGDAADTTPGSRRGATGGDGTAASRPGLAPSGLDADVRLPLTLIALGLILCAAAARKRRRQEVPT